MQYQNYQNNNNPFMNDNFVYDQSPNFAKERKPEHPKKQSGKTGYYTVLVLILLLLIPKCLGNLFFLLNIMGIHTYRDEVLTLMIACISLL